MMKVEKYIFLSLLLFHETSTAASLQQQGHVFLTMRRSCFRNVWYEVFGFSNSL